MLVTPERAVAFALACPAIALLLAAVRYRHVERLSWAGWLGLALVRYLALAVILTLGGLAAFIWSRGLSALGVVDWTGIVAIYPPVFVVALITLAFDIPGQIRRRRAAKVQSG